MATRAASEPPPRPEVGDTLIVIHDFQARSSDELSLSKGDRVELIERDDEFGDGWFLGRHLANDNTGLFPEVYTRPAPRNVPVIAPSQPLSSVPETKNHTEVTDIVEAPTATPSVPKPSSTPIPTKKVADSSTSLPLQPIKSETSAPPSITTTSSPAPEPDRTPSQTHDSQVLNDTLNVINEHITHLRGSPSNGGLRLPPGANDSESEYSMPLDQRMSYIQGEETDEEEDREHSRPEVESWNADQVAEYLFTSGVEKQHCEVFRDQEITGEVLLGMDQSSLFIKAFDLGSVGRRLKTWHKIKALQDEVTYPAPSTRRTTQTWGSDVGSEDARGSRSRANTTMTSTSNRVSSHRTSFGQIPKISPTTIKSPLSPSSSHDSPTRPSHTKRPSAASVRELHHSRRHSSTDYRAPPPITGVLPGTTPPALSPNGTILDPGVSHKKEASFDRNWTLGNAFGGQPPPARPLSSAGLQDLRTGSDPDLQDSAVDLDRGYFSGTETDGRRRNVLRKRDGAGHSRQSSYADEQRVRSATALSRHSRFGSVDSFRDPSMSPAVQKYFGVQPTPHRRTASTATVESVRPIPPAKDSPAPIVTRIDTGLNPTRSPASPVNTGKQGFAPDWLAAVVNKPMSKGRPGMRAISDKLTSNRSKDIMPSDGALDSPGRTVSSIASGEPSIDIDSPATGKSFNSTPASKSSKRKGKKDTSAYTRGLLKIGPLEAKQGADYYGWMKKKSSNLMTTWKPRLFVLKGRRLAYYYSEDDDQEKGLIDISFHRVLPAGNERLTGLHATLTGAAGGGPSIPLIGNDSAGTADKSNEPVFIFKLMPPRAGLSRAVNFTKPTVHYFAVPNIEQGRLWMAALMKATIDRDDSQPITTTYQQKTISLTKAKQMRHRPPALMNLDETAEDDDLQPDDSPKPVNGLGIIGESDSGVAGMGQLNGVTASINTFSAEQVDTTATVPEQSA
ncbi:hypothetical protein QQS21_008604 [Conoideocrella luteorostrata]|uniref:Uncharacterized protein n=1 Tax=Conoideocrella luteorostrata TaxID=1105319 RepID=A0AAJ0FR27_9HYPO|nr:hypothetical protein QQS21_008604 [Conoideocrella luteorostrata]